MIVKNARTVGVVYHYSILHAMDVVDRVRGDKQTIHSVRPVRDQMPPDLQWRIDADLRKRLGVLHEYQIVWENMGTAAAHMHVEFDPSD